MSPLAVVSVCVVALAAGFLAGMRFGMKRRRHRRTGFRGRGTDRPLVR